MQATITSGQLDMAKMTKMVQIFMPPRSSDARDKDVETGSSMFNFVVVLTFEISSRHFACTFGWRIR